MTGNEPKTTINNQLKKQMSMTDEVYNERKERLEKGLERNIVEYDSIQEKIERIDYHWDIQSRMHYAKRSYLKALAEDKHNAIQNTRIALDKLDEQYATEAEEEAAEEAEYATNEEGKEADHGEAR